MSKINYIYETDLYKKLKLEPYPFLAEELAKQAGIYRKSENFAGYSDEYIKIEYVEIYGRRQPIFYFSEKGIEKISEYLHTRYKTIKKSNIFNL